MPTILQALSSRGRAIAAWGVVNDKLSEEVRQGALHPAGIPSPPSPSSLATHHTLFDRYLQLTLADKKVVQELEGEVLRLGKRSLAARVALGGINAPRDSAAQLGGQVASLRLCVDAATRRLQALLHKNASVDRSLEALWRGAEERRRVKGSLRRRLAAGEAQQGVSLQVAQGALVKRYTTLLGIAAVQQAAHSEKMALEEELGRMEALTLVVGGPKGGGGKGGRGQVSSPSPSNANANAIATAAAAARPSLPPSSSHSTSTTGAAQETRLRKELEGAMGEERRWRCVGDLEGQRIGAFEEAFSTVAASTGAGSVEEVLRVWRENEECNFALFHKLAVQAGEIQKVEGEVSGLRKEASKFGEVAWREALRHTQQVKGRVQGQVQQVEQQAQLEFAVGLEVDEGEGEGEGGGASEAAAKALFLHSGLEGGSEEDIVGWNDQEDLFVAGAAAAAATSSPTALSMESLNGGCHNPPPFPPPPRPPSTPLPSLTPLDLVGVVSRGVGELMQVMGGAEPLEKDVVASLGFIEIRVRAVLTAYATLVKACEGGGVLLTTTPTTATPPSPSATAPMLTPSTAHKHSHSHHLKRGGGGGGFVTAGTHTHHPSPPTPRALVIMGVIHPPTTLTTIPPPTGAPHNPKTKGGRKGVVPYRLLPSSLGGGKKGGVEVHSGRWGEGEDDEEVVVWKRGGEE